MLNLHMNAIALPPSKMQANCCSLDKASIIGAKVEKFYLFIL